MVDESLSACVVAYVGRPGRVGGPSAEERVLAACGTAGTARIEDARAILTALDRAEPAPWRAGEITAVAAQATAFLREHFPELSDEAVRAVVHRYSYSWK